MPVVKDLVACMCGSCSLTDLKECTCYVSKAYSDLFAPVTCVHTDLTEVQRHLSSRRVQS